VSQAYREITHVLELRNIRPRDVDQRLVALHNPLLNQRLHPKMVVLDSKLLKIAPGEHQRPEILIDGLEQSLRRRHSHPGRVDILVAAVAVDAIILSDPAPACASKGLDGENIAFFHALVRLGLDEWNLFVAVDFVAQDVVAGQAANGFDREGFAFDLDFVAFHCFLDHLAYMIDTGVDAGFL
jgi:hypothetical protein